MHFNKATIAIFAIAFSQVFAAPVTEPEALEKRDLASTLSGAANTLNTAAGASLASINAGVSQAAKAVTASATILADAKINANLAALLAGVNTAATGVAAAVSGGVKTLTAPQIASVEASIGSLESTSTNILAVLMAAVTGVSKESATEAAAIEAQAKVIANSIATVAASLKTYLGAVTVTGGAGATGSLTAAQALASSLASNVSQFLSSVSVTK